MVFVLALKDFKSQTIVACGLMLLIHSKKNIQAIHQAKNNEAGYQIVKKSR